MFIAKTPLSSSIGRIFLKGIEYYNQKKTVGDDIQDILVYMKNHFMIRRQCQVIRDHQKIQDQKRECSGEDTLYLEKRLEAIDYIDLDPESLRVYRKMHPEQSVRAYRGSIKSSDRKICECRRSAKKREIPYELTYEQSKKLISGNCFYCDCLPTKCKFHGIDRLDHNECYIFNNCVTSCWTCNKIKRCYDPYVFLDMCEHILTHLQKFNGVLHSRLFTNFNTGKSVSFMYDEYICSANKRKYEWSLSMDDFTNIIKQDCYLCGKMSNDEHTNGIDRYDSTIGYVMSNARPCCGTCNYMKIDIQYDIFIEKLTRIYTNRESILSKLNGIDI